MSVVLVFFSLWIGVVLKYSPIVLCVLLVILLVFAFLKYKKKIGLICLGVAILGFGISFIDVSANPKDDVYSGFVIESKSTYFIFYSSLERMYVSSYDNTYEVGDYLAICGQKEDLTFKTLESSFDFGEYLEKKGVTSSLKVTSIEVKFAAPLRLNEIKNNFLDNFDEDTANFINALFFSSTSDGELSTNLTTLHLSRFASASGLYIYAFINALVYLFSFILPKKWAKVCSFILLLPYFVLLYPRFTIVRICTMYILRWINEYCLKKRFSSLQLTSMAGSFFLLFNHYLARQDSFILGFSIPFVYYFINTSLPKIKNRFAKRCVNTLTFGVFFIPFEAYFYSSINLLTYPLQLLLTPFFVVLAFMTLLCLFKVPLYGAVNWYTGLLNKGCSWLTKINISFYCPSFSPWIIFAFIALFFLLLYFIQIKHKPLIKLSATLLIGITLFEVVPITNYVSDEVVFIDVGQGDSTLIRIKNRAVLIDTGGLRNTDIATDVLIPLFKKERIYSLDCVFITHDDYDHDGALASLCDNFTVKNVISYGTYTEPITIGGVTFTNYNDNAPNHKEENDRSLVLGWHLMDLDFLVMGDATTNVEYEIMDNYDSIPCDVLKVGHHGSSTSSSDEFIRYLDPNDAIISCGLNNSYGHPTNQTLETLNKYGVNIYRTDLEGSIRYFKYSLW
ncbi:MAG: ComEC/Rec2 family competence protein [Coprobacillus sp.]|nr:ComEC/Rec2 family competence protein [Coprobacillus sp.]